MIVRTDKIRDCFFMSSQTLDDNELTCIYKIRKVVIQ